MAAALDAEFDPRSVLLPNIVNHFSKVKPDAVYAEYPVSTLTYEEGYRQITYRDFANVINGLAWWLKEKLGPGKDQDVENLAYIGPNDLRYRLWFWVRPRLDTAYVEWLSGRGISNIHNSPYITSQ